MTEETIREMAYIAWKGAANAHRMYPDNKHTFVDYWDAAKNQFAKFIASQPSSEHRVEGEVFTPISKIPSEGLYYLYTKDGVISAYTYFSDGKEWCGKIPDKYIQYINKK